MDVLERPRSTSSTSGGARLARGLVALIVATLLLGALALVGFRLARPGVLPGAELADMDLGGLPRTEAEALVGDHADARAAREIVITRDDVEHTATAADAGYRFDVAATQGEVWARGRQLNPVTEVVTQEGREGFDITDVRVLTFPDGRVERESIFTRYLPEPRIIEHAP